MANLRSLINRLKVLIRAPGAAQQMNGDVPAPSGPGAATVAAAVAKLPGPEQFHVSQAYYDAVQAIVAKHPSAGDAAFVDKLVRYYLGTNKKGIRLVGEIGKELESAGLSLRGARFLDLGSGNGGSLVGAFEHGASYCEGWEINDDKLDLSHLNIDTLYEPDGPIRIRKISLDEPLNPDADFQPFDVIFCQEVLEHVKNLEQSVSTLYACLNAERGAAYLSIPNGYSLNNVISDSHLQLFGIGLLERHEAQPLATAIKNHLHYSEMMGTYLHFDEYVSLFRRHGLECAPRPGKDAKIADLEALASKIGRVEQVRETRLHEWREKVDPDTLALLAERTLIYLQEARSRFEQVRSAGPTPPQAVSFLREYDVDVFEFFVWNADNKRMAAFANHA